VLTPSHVHADVVVDTLDAEVHTLVEKPLAATPADAERMVEAARASEATAMVAYMKRYDPAYERMVGAVDDLARVDLVTAYDVDPDHGRIVEEVYDLVDGDLPAGQRERSVANRREAIATALGTDETGLVDAYDFQIEHVCHDVNALRGLFGAVERVEYVDIFADGRYATAHLRYEDGVRCVLESGDSDRKWFEEFVRVDGPDGAVELDFSNPFIRNTPSELRVERGIEEHEYTVHTPSYEEPFKRELVHFLRCIEGEASVRTPFAEAAADVELVVELFEQYQRTGGSSGT
jgi:predicted dehydrogenase